MKIQSISLSSSMIGRVMRILKKNDLRSGEGLMMQVRRKICPLIRSSMQLRKDRVSTCGATE